MSSVIRKQRLLQCAFMLAFILSQASAIPSKIKTQHSVFESHSGIEKMNSSRDLLGTDFQRCTIVLSWSGCLAVLLHPRWALTVQSCTRNVSISSLSARYLTQKGSIAVKIKEIAYKDNFGLIFLEEALDLAELGECFGPLYPAATLDQNRQFTIPVIPKQACEGGMLIPMSTTFIASRAELCSPKENGKHWRSHLCLSLEQRDTNKEFCEPIVGSPIVTRTRSGNFNIVGLIDGKMERGRVKRATLTSPEKTASGHVFSQGDVQWMRSLRARTTSDPICAKNGHKVLREKRRQVSSFLLGAVQFGSFLCDGSLKEAWYRFEIDGFPAEAANHCPPLFSCGTREPVWLSMQKRPNIGEEVVTDGCRAVQYQGKNICCAWKLEVRVKNCGDFLVYRLGPTGYCPSAYCVEDGRYLKAKKDGLKTDVSAVSKVEVAPIKLINTIQDEKFPNITRKPQIFVRASTRKFATEFFCSFSFKARYPHKARFTVNWYRPVTFFGGKFGRISLFSQTVNTSPSRYTVRVGNDIAQGILIFCDVKPFYVGALGKGKSVGSPGFYVGIKVVPNQLTISEDQKVHSLKFISTVPIICKKQFKTCSISIPVYVNVDNPDPKKLATLRSDITLSSCEVTINPTKCGPNGCGTGTIRLSAVTDFIQDGDRWTRIATARVRSPKAVGWKNHDPPDVKVHVKDIETNRCSLILSGTIIRLNGKSSVMKSRGSFILYKSLAREFEVHTRFWPCSTKPDASCSCGFVVKENFDVISIDMCDGKPGKSAVQISILSGTILSPGVQITKANQGKRFSVYFPSGAFVRADTFEWGMNIFIQSPSVDTGNVAGLCTDKSDDYYKGKADLARLGDLNNIFTMIASPGDPVKQDVMCACSLPDIVKAYGSCNASAVSGCSQAYSCQRNDRVSVPLLSFEMDITDIILSNMLIGHHSRLYVFPWDDVTYRQLGVESDANGLKSRLKPADPRQCERSLNTGLFAVLCRESLRVDLSLISSHCVDALSNEPAVSLFGYLESKCEENVIKNASTWVTVAGGQIVPSLAIQRHLCPNLCSGHGTCSNGVCYCSRGFTSSDCSIQVNQAPAVYSLLDNGECDLVYDDCNKVTVIGNGFMESHQLSCTLIPMLLVNRSWSIQPNRVSSAAMFESYRSVMCSLPKPRIPTSMHSAHVLAYGYQISVTNDQYKLSDFVTAIVYNGTCLTCGKTQNGKCKVKEGYCIINQVCYDEHARNPSNKCLSCKPDVSQYSWSNGKNGKVASGRDREQINLLVGDVLVKQLEGKGGGSNKLKFSSAHPLPVNALLTKDGILTFIPTRPENVAMLLVIENQCGEREYKEITIQVSPCLCKNDGKCERFTNFTLGTEHYYCLCPSGYAGALCEKKVLDCANNCNIGTCVKENGVEVCKCKRGYSGIACDVFEPCKKLNCVHGNCSDVNSKPVCACQTGFTGLRCETGINPCNSSPCNGGKCSALSFKEFTCSCPSDRKGKLCDLPMQCPTRPCQNGGNCIELATSFKCECKEGYDGDLCDHKIDFCEGNPCNHGKCISGNVDYKCVCDSDYTGPNCSVKINYCSTRPCINGQCTNVIGGFSCKCFTGYEGKTCELVKDYCLPDPCENGACVSRNGSFECRCSKGFTGVTCGKKISPCAVKPCVNGHCFSTEDNYTCICNGGYLGRNCDRRDYCFDYPCIYGKCVNKKDRFSCLCDFGYEGPTCSERKNYCRVSKCKHGRCINKFAGYSCVCDVGYTGKNCDRRVDNCRVNHCVGGQCKNTLTGYTCICNKGYSGRFCEKVSDYCLENRCVHGKCISTPNWYRCECDQGYEGIYCNTTNTFCDKNPCLHGTCVTENLGFRCECEENYQGIICESLKNLCESSPCVNGQCSMNAKGYTCACVAGYEGKNCDLRVDYCKDNPCVNGFCSSLDSGYVCACAIGYEGKQCDVMTDYCKIKPCQHGTCVSERDGPRCTCFAGYQGVFCHEKTDYCRGVTCFNEGTCVSGNSSFNCRCPRGYEGQFCEKEVDFCKQSPCVNGICVNGKDGFRCTCNRGYEGRLCNVNVDYCKSNPCVQGNCTSSSLGFGCLCFDGFEGVLCNEKIDHCKSNPCSNGRCIDGERGYSCVCDVGYEGDNCGVLIDHCRNNPCRNGSCSSSSEGFHCNCFRGFEGVKCDRLIDNCQTRPCQNGVCHNKVGDFSCTCNMGYEGKRCDIETDNCKTNPCVYGKCSNLVGSFKCSCNKGYEGQRCEVQTDNCKTNPCVYGKCSNLVGSFKCSCNKGYEGQRCEVQTDNCKTSPCVYGKCSNLVGSFKCSCHKGYQGEKCEVQTDNCKTNPCVYGKCSNLVGSFKCSCHKGYEGQRCEVQTDNCKTNPCVHGKCSNWLEVSSAVVKGYEGKDTKARSVKFKQTTARPILVCMENVPILLEVSSVLVIKDTKARSVTLKQTTARPILVFMENVPIWLEVSNAVATKDTKAKGVKFKQTTARPILVCMENVPILLEVSSVLVIKDTKARSVKFKQTTARPILVFMENVPILLEVSSAVVTRDTKAKGVKLKQTTARPILVCMENVPILLEVSSAVVTRDTKAKGYHGEKCEIQTDNCKTNPCVNGKCSNLVGSFKCICHKGYEGQRCEIQTDNCKTNPCVNGKCSNLVGSFKCTCHKGYEGQRCEAQTDNCKTNPCVHGKCSNLVGDFTCSCFLGYEGENCSSLIDYCKDNPCINGLCVALKGGFNCKCSIGYTGRNCEERIDYCADRPCQHGLCKSLIGSFECACAPGFTGKRCEVEIDHCESNPCVHGKCSSYAIGYVCDCERGYYGRTCAVSIDPCLRVNCLNGGQCVADGGKFSCSCRDGFEGVLCERQVDRCIGNPCKHGTCLSTLEGARCLCKENYEGRFCDRLVDICRSNPCLNRGKCQGNDANDKYTCSCLATYTGDRCEIRIDPCETMPCGGHGLCFRQGDNYSCLCFRSYYGPKCSKRRLPCDKVTCQNNGTCVNRRRSFQCRCRAGYTGRYCQTRVDACRNKPCGNGVCIGQYDGSYKCLCNTGYAGLNCLNKIGSCKLRNPCVNGQCINSAEGVECSCSDGYTGRHCETRIDLCKLKNPCRHGVCESNNGVTVCVCNAGYLGSACDTKDPCFPNPCNGGRCTVGNGNMAKCACKEDYTGLYCENKVDPCHSSPCKYGTCIRDAARTYRCICSDGWTGEKCDADIDECTAEIPRSESTTTRTPPPTTTTTTTTTLKPTTTATTLALTTAVQDPCVSNPCDPLASCNSVELSINSAGFKCGPCPTGYQGDGFTCKSKCDLKRLVHQTRASDGLGALILLMVNSAVAGALSVIEETDKYANLSAFEGVLLDEFASHREDVDVPKATMDTGVIYHCVAKDASMVVDVLNRINVYVKMVLVETIAEPDFVHHRAKMVANVLERTLAPVLMDMSASVTCRIKCANGGVCDGPFSCRCPVGYGGRLCQLHMCNPSCKNGGRCVGPGKCQCPNGYVGPQCQEGVCIPSCMNGGTCVRPGVCTCRPGFVGRNCEQG
eukprot:gene9603-10590_t